MLSVSPPKQSRCIEAVQTYSTQNFLLSKEARVQNLVFTFLFLEYISETFICNLQKHIDMLIFLSIHVSSSNEKALRSINTIESRIQPTICTRTFCLNKLCGLKYFYYISPSSSSSIRIAQFWQMQ